VPETLEGERYTVTGTSRACFFPRTEAETNFCREFDGRTPAGPFDLHGSIYGRSLEFRGSGCCRGLVVSRGDLRIELSRKGEQARFLGTLSATGAVTVRVPHLPFRDGLCGDIRKASVLIRGDVVGDQVDLANAVIVGNVHATNVRLRGCVVFGSVVATEKITLEASTILYYHARSIQFAGPCMMLHAMGESASMPIFAALEDFGGEVLPCDMRYYPVVRSQERGGLSNRPWERPPDSNASRLYPWADWIGVATEAGGDAAEQLGIGSRTVLTIAGRALNLASLQLATSQLTGMLRISFEFDHYSPANQRASLDKIAAIATEDERWVFTSLLSPLES
jgi:hypothetical protein